MIVRLTHSLLELSELQPPLIQINTKDSYTLYTYITLTKGITQIITTSRVVPLLVVQLLANGGMNV